MILEVYDLESLSNLFTYTGYCPKENKWYQFVICKWRNESKELFEHLNRDKIVHVGFNNKSYDSPLIHHFLRHYKGNYEFKDGQDIACSLYTKSQTIISQEFSALSDSKEQIKQIDLYKILHLDNKARLSSLKDLEFYMRMENVEEMPLHYTHWCVKGEEELILSYNKNDVFATYNVLKLVLGKTDNPKYSGKDKIALRQAIKRKFNIPCLNYPDVKIGEQLILSLYCNKTGANPQYLKKLGGTPRPSINLGDCIPKWVNFKTKEFQEIERKFRNTTITSIKGSFNESVIFHGCKMDYGTGGLHSCIKPGIYSADDYWMILDEDVGSLYPSLAINLGLYPEHLGPEFLEIYDEDIVSVRLAEKKKPSKERDMVIMEGFKLSANGIYGKSGEDSSFLYDPLYTMKTTIGGQMFISMWTEKLVEAIPEIKFLQHNTDGLTYLLPRKDLDKAKKVSQEMTELTGLYIEDNTYSKMMLRDVNNYIGVYEDNTREHENLKLKGDFEINKECHKDTSMTIVPIAVKDYFVYGIPVKETIKNHTDIFDFCLRLKTNSKSTPLYRHLVDGKIVNDKLGRTTRYYVSNSGGVFLKDFGDGRLTGVNVGYSVTEFNRYVKKDIKDYDLNYNFYIAEANKLINAVDDGQLELFF